MTTTPNNSLRNALLETFGVELEPTDLITFEHNYCGDHIVDVIVTDTKSGTRHKFPMFDTRYGIFPHTP